MGKLSFVLSGYEVRRGCYIALPETVPSLQGTTDKKGEVMMGGRRDRTHQVRSSKLGRTLKPDWLPFTL